MWTFSRFADRIAAVTEDGTEYTYATLAEKGENLAEIVGRRCLIFCLCSNSFGSLLGYTSFLNHHIVPLMLDEQMDDGLLDSFLQIYQPDYMWLAESRAADFDGTVVYRDCGYVLLKRKDESVFSLNDELALLITTSGSTGSPKLVRQSYKNLEANTKSIVAYLHLDGSERPITTLPMNYTYGLSVINTHLAVGATLILTDKTLMQREFWNLFNEQKVSSFAGVPYTYEMLDKLMFFRRKLPYLKSMTQAGGKILPILHQKFAEYAKNEGKEFVVMYGQAEATARMGYLPANIALDKCGCMGIAIPGGKFHLIDADGNTITSPETVGELVYEGDNVALGYAENGADLAKGDECHGLLQTGDMAKFDQDGIYSIVGRKKRFLKIFGNRVNLDETERLIKTQYLDFDCVCAGKDDSMEIFITDASKIKEIQSFVANKTHLNFSAFHVHYLAEIPKNDAGKVLYTELNKLC